MLSKKIIKISFCVLFAVMLAVPLVTTNLKKNKISKEENRVLAQMPSIYKADETLNKNFLSEFENWFDDNVGLRSEMVAANGLIQYGVFGRFDNNRNLFLGPNGEINYATSAMMRDYQHLNLYSEQYLKDWADSLQYISDYLGEKGKQMYYYQCWDKHSIYPEYFPDTVIQHGDSSKTDGIVKALEEYSTVNVISPKQELLDGKKDYDTYSKYGDATHWAQRGAYIGYLKLMKAINEANNNRFKVLAEEDYNLTLTDQGRKLFGIIRKQEMLENFQLKEPHAKSTREKLTLYADDGRHFFYTNDTADNNIRLLVIGDSYFYSYIIDDIAESFKETIFIMGDYVGNIGAILDEYDPDIVIIEAAERVDRTSAIIAGAKALREANK